MPDIVAEIILKILSKAGVLYIILTQASRYHLKRIQRKVPSFKIPFLLWRRRKDPSQDPADNVVLCSPILQRQVFSFLTIFSS
jgi:hypothetical protein